MPSAADVPKGIISSLAALVAVGHNITAGSLQVVKNKLGKRVFPIAFGREMETAPVHQRTSTERQS